MNIKVFIRKWKRERERERERGRDLNNLKYNLSCSNFVEAGG